MGHVEDSGVSKAIYEFRDRIVDALDEAMVDVAEDVPLGVLELVCEELSNVRKEVEAEADAAVNKAEKDLDEYCGKDY